jgi:hypothetical protein
MVVRLMALTPTLSIDSFISFPYPSTARDTRFMPSFLLCGERGETGAFGLATPKLPEDRANSSLLIECGYEIVTEDERNRIP